MESAWPLHWLIEERVITWTEGHTLMNILDVDQTSHVHEATLAAQYRSDEKANKRR